MDEYLFIALARLKADRLQLNRAQRAEAESQQLRLELTEPAETSRSAVPRPVRSSALARWFSQQPIWREQS